jgi:protein TIF31
MEEFEKHMKEAKQYKFNTNVFKTVKLAMTDDEVKAEEEQVKELTEFLHKNAIPKLVKELKSIEGIPTDSKSLSSTFHQHGVNMRYLGEVANSFKDKNEY